jgi:hypothetical protein
LPRFSADVRRKAACGEGCERVAPRGPYAFQQADEFSTALLHESPLSGEGLCLLHMVHVSTHIRRLRRAVSEESTQKALGRHALM